MRSSAYSLFLLLGIALAARLWLVLGAEPQPFAPYLNRAAVVVGVVSDDPDVRDTAVRVSLAVSTINTQSVKGRVSAVLSPSTSLEYGDTIAVRGLLEAPQAFETQMGRTFDYSGYLRARGISAIVQHAVLRNAESGGWSVMRQLFEIKHSFERALERVMRGEPAALMEGFLLGEKHGLSQELTQAFVLVGLIHVVVLSGYNIGVVSEWVLRLLGACLPRRAALVGTAVVILLFALMAGGGMATVRALLMGLIAILARFLRRPALALRSLGAAVVLMVLYNPLVLYDVGFVLSVLATFGLITLAPAIEHRLAWLPAGAIRATAATTASVQLFVLPALLYYTGVLSFLALPVNVVVLPLVPLAMLLGFAAGVLSLVHPFLALVPALAAEWLLAAMIWLAQWVAALPFAATVVSAFPWWVALGAYVPLTALAMWSYVQTAPQAPPN